MRMSSPSFTRDEVILALDVLYSAGEKTISADSREIQDLSLLLNRLPIHPVENRRLDFRNKTGIARQINLYRSSCNAGKRDPNVGIKFFEVAFEFKDHYDELHSIAEAIRKNEPYYSLCFGNPIEDNCFPEGALLGRLHRVIELRDEPRVPLHDCCEVCNLKPTLYYQPCGPILQQHLLIPPTQIDGKKKYGADSFITICPNCHEVLHHYRP